MRAMQVQTTSQGPALRPEQVSQPATGPSEVLIRVHAAGVTPTELGWYPTSHTRSGTPRLNAIPGHEFSGTVAALGQEVKGFAVGQAVYGMNDWFVDGATADFCLTIPSSIASKPVTLTHEEVATLPIGSLTHGRVSSTTANFNPTSASSFTEVQVPLESSPFSSPTVTALTS
jgi:NADPH:quinone reductase-like Zn-dependent oxidoreductase